MTDQPTPRMRMTYTEALDAASLQLEQAANGGWHAQDADHYANVGSALVAYAREIREDAAYRAQLDAEATAQSRAEFAQVIDDARRDYRPGMPDNAVPPCGALSPSMATLTPCGRPHRHEGLHVAYMPGGSTHEWSEPTGTVVVGSTAPRECNRCGLPAVWREDLPVPQWAHVDHDMSVEAAGHSHSPSFD
jgi:hypothetical protein